jgi:hypothetical protein
VYVHVLDWPASDMLWVPVGAKVKSAKYLKDGSKAEILEVDSGVLLKGIPQRIVDEYDTIVVLELAS